MSGKKRKVEEYSSPRTPEDKSSFARITPGTELHIPNSNGSHRMYVDVNDVMNNEIVITNDKDRIEPMNDETEEFIESSTGKIYKFQKFTTDMIGNPPRRLCFLFHMPHNEKHWLPLWVINNPKSDNPTLIGLTTENYRIYGNNTVNIYIKDTENKLTQLNTVDSMHHIFRKPYGKHGGKRRTTKRRRVKRQARRTTRLYTFSHSKRPLYGRK
jgi:hypothetical protein